MSAPHAFIQYNPNLKPPYDTGFELVGEVVALGEAAAAAGSVKLGDYVACMRTPHVCNR